MKKIVFDYSPFFETLKEKNLSRNRFMLENHISNEQMFRLRHNRNMAFSTLIRLLEFLGEEDIRKVVRIVVVDDTVE